MPRVLFAVIAALLVFLVPQAASAATTKCERDKIRYSTVDAKVERWKQTQFTTSYSVSWCVTNKRAHFTNPNGIKFLAGSVVNDVRGSAMQGLLDAYLNTTLSFDGKTESTAKVTPGGNLFVTVRPRLKACVDLLALAAAALPIKLKGSFFHSEKWLRLSISQRRALIKNIQDSIASKLPDVLISRYRTVVMQILETAFDTAGEAMVVKGVGALSKDVCVTSWRPSLSFTGFITGKGHSTANVAGYWDDATKISSHTQHVTPRTSSKPADAGAPADDPLAGDLGGLDDPLGADAGGDVVPGDVVTGGGAATGGTTTGGGATTPDPAGGGTDTTPTPQPPAPPPPNQAPVAYPDTFVLNKTSTVHHNRFMRGADADGSIAAYQVVTQSFGGATFGFSYNSATGQWFIHGTNTVANLNFTFRVMDNAGVWSAPATVTINFR
jgi:hypothetical protein